MKDASPLLTLIASDGRFIRREISNMESVIDGFDSLVYLDNGIANEINSMGEGTSIALILISGMTLRSKL